MPSINTMNCAELHAALKHIKKLEEFVAQESQRNQGPGWSYVIDILDRDRKIVENEIKNAANLHLIL
ncbi:hypothetical protein [Gluconacetobacter diazotrophicus]|uniref:Uncharacterized protein n=1 Tax=Gluconacetobacter diazotrophicus (strain ATCC 49037 / DSM 5601 / CCUG 37298 / CIP 103539 / LMG 7603 / PAl5) TaxID=272568 RepID=A9HQ24_GLUDA|nr:hypothetical protein [Gluconacetobacter diazotrophicus]CAP56666.1 hypothetical protein GDI2723 [Gluconacetobacter diazotrophicus PA1 5]